MNLMREKTLACGAITVASVALSYGFSQTKVSAATKLSSIPHTFRGTWHENDG